MGDIADRIRSEAAIADRPGSLARLEAIADEVAELEDEWAGIIVRGLPQRCPDGCTDHLHAADGTPVGFKHKYDHDCRCEKCLAVEARSNAVTKEEN